jgi:hypothetical protein
MYWTKKITHIFLFLGLVLLLPVCSGNPEGEQTQTITPPDSLDTDEANNSVSKVEPPKVDKKFNDMARFIAGLSPEEGSEFTQYSQDPAWKAFAQQTDTQWEKINANKLPKMKEWSNQELQAANEAKGLVFYPFSGPDFMHASVFFPEAEQIVMIGLEPIGNLPDFEKISKKSIGGYFNGIQRTLYSILSVSFFRTISMADDFTGRVVSDIDGTLPVLMFFMERTNHKVLYYEKIAISPEGKVIPAEEAKADSTYYGSKITFQRNDHPEEYKTLYYFAANLQDSPYSARSGMSEGGLAQRTDFRKYLESLDITSTYIKSASYLMYRDSFSIIRNLILDKSKYFLQDDSGMSINFIDTAKWDLTFYGSYISPISLFSVRYQSALRQIYQKGVGVKPLPFGIGYQYQAGTSNLMLGVKK